MKISKWVTYDAEVEVDISLEDIVTAIREDTDSLENVLRGLNNTLNFIKAIPDSLIADFNDGQRKVVREYLSKEALRFK